MTPAPVSPPGIPPTPVSPLALFAAKLFSAIWFTHSKSGETASISKVLARQQPLTERFVLWCHDVLSTTAVTHSVVILALLFVHRLKSRNAINGSKGSEYGVAATALMLASASLDDHTYTAKTWAEVASLSPSLLIASEREFLAGLDFRLAVDEDEFWEFAQAIGGVHGALEGMPKRRRNVPSHEARSAQPLPSNFLPFFDDPLLRPNSVSAPPTANASLVVPFGAGRLSNKTTDPRFRRRSDDRESANFGISAPSTRYASPSVPSLPSSYAAIPFRTYPSPPATRSASKRKATDDLSSDVLLPIAKRLQPTPLSRSYTTGSSYPPPRLPYPATQFSPSYSSYSPSYSPSFSPSYAPPEDGRDYRGAVPFESLSTSFSPQYDAIANGAAAEPLLFYSLATKQRQEALKQGPPVHHRQPLRQSFPLSVLPISHHNRFVQPLPHSRRTSDPYAALPSTPIHFPSTKSDFNFHAGSQFDTNFAPLAQYSAVISPTLDQYSYEGQWIENSQQAVDDRIFSYGISSV